MPTCTLTSESLRPISEIPEDVDSADHGQSDFFKEIQHQNQSDDTNLLSDDQEFINFTSAQKNLARRPALPTRVQ